MSISQKGLATPAVKESITLSKNETVKIYLDENSEVCVQNASFPLVEQKDYTGHIVNPSFEGNSGKGWEGTPVIDYDCAEKYNTNFNIYQKVTGLPEGRYLLSVQGFYRSGTTDNAATTHKAGTERLNATLYAGDSTLVLRSIIDEAGKKGALGVMAKNYGYVPNTMEQSSAYFRAGLYPNVLPCTVASDGTLTIGIKKTSTINNDWCIFDNFTLTYLGKDSEADHIGTITAPSAVLGIFTLQGQPITASDMVSGGIYVINGHKVLTR